MYLVYILRVKDQGETKEEPRNDQRTPNYRMCGDMHNYYPEIKGFSVRNCQCMIQFYEEYNQELTLPKSGTLIAQLPVAQLGKAKTQPAVAQLPDYNFTLVAKIRSKPNTHYVISTNQ